MPHTPISYAPRSSSSVPVPSPMLVTPHPTDTEQHIRALACVARQVCDPKTGKVVLAFETFSDLCTFVLTTGEFARGKTFTKDEEKTLIGACAVTWLQVARLSTHVMQARAA